MGHHHHSAALAAGHSDEGVDDGVRVIVQARVRLVQEEQFRPPHEQGGEIRASSHAVGRLARPPMACGPEAHPSQRFICLLSSQAGEVRDQVQVLLQGQMVVQRRFVPRPADARTDVSRLGRSEGSSEDGAATGGERHEGGDHAEQRRLPCPVRARHADDGSGVDPQIDPGEDRGRSEPDGHGVQHDDGIGHPASVWPSGRRYGNSCETMRGGPPLRTGPPYDDVVSIRPDRILVIDDEPRVREVVAAYLQREGFRVDEAANADQAKAMLQGPAPDLVVLDIMFPGASGLDLLAELRTRSEVPVILLTARADEVDRVLGLELGADDYVVKPFSPRELVARVRTVLRRTRPRVEDSLVEHGDLVIDAGARQVDVAGRRVELTAKEFDLLAYMAAHPRQVFSRNQLLQEVWDSSSEWQDPATVTVHIRRLRTKLEPDAAESRWLETVWGVGYRFQP